MKTLMATLFLIFSMTCFSQNETIGRFNAEIKNQFEFKYILSKPQNTKEKQPLIIFLHGSGEKGNDLEKLKIYGPLKYIKSHQLAAFILAPQCPEGKYWDSEELYLLINKIISENSIDVNRIYLTGLSMGGWGAWNLAYAHPELFAAVVPIAGFVDRVPMIEACKLATIPIRIYHGLHDTIVDVNYSITIYKKIKECNKDIKIEIFDDAGHDSWSRVYDNSEIYEWMLLQSKN